MSTWTSLETGVYAAALILVSVGTASIVGVTVYCLCLLHRAPEMTSNRKTEAKQLREVGSSAVSTGSGHFEEEDMSQMYEDLWSYAMVSSMGPTMQSSPSHIALQTEEGSVLRNNRPKRVVTARNNEEC